MPNGDDLRSETEHAPPFLDWLGAGEELESRGGSVLHHCPAKDGFDPREVPLGISGLLEKVVRTGFEKLRFYFVPSVGGADKHRDGRRVLRPSNAIEHFSAVHTRHRQIQDHQVAAGVGFEPLYRLVPVLGQRNLVPLRLE